MLSCDEVLERARKDGSIDVQDWSRHFDTILLRLYHNVHSLFPIPSIPSPPESSPTIEPSSTTPTKQPQTPAASSTAINQSSQASNNEDTLPNTPTPSLSRSNSHLPTTATATAAMNTASDANAGDKAQDSPLAPPLLTTWNYIHNTLTANFSKFPPHTIQRLSELILNPKQHYRLLPSYLNALDRVVSVSSGSNVFPLPLDVVGGAGSVVLVNGSSASPPTTTNVDSDESVGGALLTPIPWLRNGHDNRSRSGSPGVVSSPAGTSSPHRSSAATNSHVAGVAADSENDDSDVIMTSDESEASSITLSGAGSPSDVLAGGVTQGELLRQQQEISGPPAALASVENTQHVLAVHAPQQLPSLDSGNRTDVQMSGDPGEDEIPRARGPEHIGLEDTGIPQSSQLESGIVLDMEAAVGRSHTAKSPPPSQASKPNLATAKDEEDEHARAHNSGQMAYPDVESNTVDVDGFKDSHPPPSQQGISIRGLDKGS